jgi:hypothetical protein
MVTRVYARTAAAGDAGPTVSVTLGDYAETALQLAAVGARRHVRWLCRVEQSADNEGGHCDHRAAPA